MLIRNMLTRLQTRQWELALLLLSLHGLLITGMLGTMKIAFILSHYGFFLLWQPVWRNREQISRPALILFLLVGLSLVFLMNWWVMAFWLSTLFALLGGRIFNTQSKSPKIGYLIAAGYLIFMLLLVVVPNLFLTVDTDSPNPVPLPIFFVEYGLALLPIAILFTRVSVDERGQPPVLDFFYTLILLLLAVIVVLGCFAIEASSSGNYIEILMRVIFSCAVALVVISWLWDPRAGFVGIGQLLSRYLLSIGLPFEKWIKNIAEHADSKQSAKDFTQAAMAEVAELPWVSALEWTSPEGDGQIGSKTKHSAQYTFHDFHLTLYTPWPLTPAMTIHLKLLTQVLGEFYEAKRREETLSQNVYMQAVYETGSRLTHDIKNLLQSLSALCSAAEHSTEEDNDRLLALIKKQLPILNQRLARTLEKLEAPKVEKNRIQKLATWWGLLKQHHAENNIEFSAGDLPSVDIDPDFLDSIVDNLIQNAIEKRKQDRGIEIRVRLNATPEYLVDVTDTGKAMPDEIAQHLFKKQVSSQNGLGIGLYHAGKQSLQMGYMLYLHHNESGQVSFRLRQLSEEEQAAESA